MKRLFVLVALVSALAIPATAAAGSVTVDQLENAGWFCVDPDGPAGPLEIHCFTKANQGVSATSTAMVFDPLTHEFLGTEVLRYTSRDLSGLPCQKVPGGYWEDLGFAWACHHWKN